MKERPIIMTPENAQKVHDQIKTQMRRIIKPQIEGDNGTGRWTYTVSSSDRKSEDQWNFCIVDETGHRYTERGKERVLFAKKCPYGQVGDRLWIREAWAWPGEEYRMHKGNSFDALLVEEWKKDKNLPQVKWRSALYMPRHLCRTVVELTRIRIQRLQEITKADVIAEGITGLEDVHAGWHQPYAQLWESINGKGSWDLNPWVWVLVFHKLDKEGGV